MASAYSSICFFFALRSDDVLILNQGFQHAEEPLLVAGIAHATTQVVPDGVER